MSLTVQTGNSEASLDQRDINYTIILEYNFVNIIFHLGFFPPLKLLNLVRTTSGWYYFYVKILTTVLCYTLSFIIYNPGFDLIRHVFMLSSWE